MYEKKIYFHIFLLDHLFQIKEDFINNNSKTIMRKKKTTEYTTQYRCYLF